MSFLQSEVPSPRQALASLRRKRADTDKPAAPSKRPASPRKARGSGRSVVGLDIEPGFVAAVETVPGGLAVRRAAVAELPTDVVRDGEVIDPIALGAVLKNLFEQHKLPNRVRVGLANQRIVMRTVDLPPIDDPKQLASVIRFQAQEHIAMPLDQAVLEYQSLGLVGTADGPRARVILVAARRDMVSRLVSALTAAGLRPEGIDLSAFALIRALYRPGDGESRIAYLNVGASTNLAVAAGTVCQFTRVVPLGFDAMVEDLASRRSLTSEHAAGWLRHVGMLAPVAEIEGQPDIVQASREALEDGVARIAAEVQATLGFYSQQPDGGPAQSVVLTGRAAAIWGFPERLATELGLPVEVRSVGEATPGAFGGTDPSQLTVAAGLTTTEVPS